MSVEEALFKEGGGNSLKYDVEIQDDDSQSKDGYGNPKYAETQTEWCESNGGCCQGERKDSMMRLEMR